MNVTALTQVCVETHYITEVGILFYFCQFVGVGAGSLACRRSGTASS